MEALLDFSAPLNVELLDQVVKVMHYNQGPQRTQADRVLTAFREHPDSWRQADKIIDAAGACLESKYFALQLLESVIRFRWRSLPVDQRETVKAYLTKYIIGLSSNESAAAEQGVFLRKLDLLLVHVLKHDWPRNWPDFIPQLVAASKTSEVQCENNVYILKLLGEELFDFSKESLTAARAEVLRGALTAQLPLVCELTDMVLQRSQRKSLVKGTLQMLQRYVTRMPDAVLFTPPLLPMLCQKFLPVPDFRVDTLLVLTEVGSLERPLYNPIFEQLYIAVMTELVRLVPPHADVREVFRGRPQDQLFLRHLALFLTGFFKAHLAAVEAPHLQALLNSGLDYLVKISDLDDPEILKICLEYWHFLALDMYAHEVMLVGGAAAVSAALPGLAGDDGEAGLRAAVMGAAAAASGGSGGGGGGGAGGAGGPAAAAAFAARKELHAETLMRVREIMIKHMAKPEEIMIEEDDSGEIVREATKDTDVLAQYKVMKDTLVYLTHLNPSDTQRIMLERLSSEVSTLGLGAGGGGGAGGPAGGAAGGGAGGGGSSPGAGPRHSWDALNKLCWAIGSISGTLSKTDEKSFLVMVIRELLGMTEAVKGKNNKAVVASNIMYVVGQYPRFLKEHWKFLKTVVQKLFEFMHESHPGVQDMAVDTFLKIANKCRKKFVAVQAGETCMFVQTLCDDLPATISDLATHQAHTFFEATGAMVAAHPDPATRAALTEHLMRSPNDLWATLMTRASEDYTVLTNPEALRSIQRVLRTNLCACRAIGPSFDRQLGRLYMDAIHVYKALSENIKAAVAGGGEGVLRSEGVRAARQVKREVLQLVGVFVAAADDCGFVARTFLPPLLAPVLQDYASSPPGAREAEVLTLMADCVAKLRSEVAEHVPGILSAVLAPTLSMITPNFSDFPEHRTAYYRLLGAVTQHAFPALFRVSAEEQGNVVASVLFAAKHEARDIGESGLEILDALLRSVSSAAVPAALAQPFFHAHLLGILKDVFGVLTDRLHKAHLKQQAGVLQYALALVEGGRVGVNLWECPLAVASGTAAQAAALAAAGTPLTNASFVRLFYRALVSSVFPNLQPIQVSTFVEGLFDQTKDAKAYKSHLRDFLITIMELAGEEGAQELYAEEVALDRARKEAAEAARRAAIPGLLNPYSAALPDDGGDDAF